MSNTHTPGPWKETVMRWPNGQLNGAPYIYAPNGADERRHVAEVYDNGQVDANARLIAAAPELLEQLKALCTQLEAAGLIVPPGVTAVIAKAEGSSRT